MSSQNAAKVCSQCNESKVLTEFPMKGHVARSYCKSCDSQYKKNHKARVLLDPEHHRKWQDTINACQDKNQKETRTKATGHYGAWTESDDAFMRANWDMPRKEVALHLGRTYAAVATRRLKLKKLSERSQR